MKELNLTIPGFSIAGKTWGNIEKPAILALHGWLDNANSFSLIAPYLQNNFYFIAVDLPGHGHSDHLPIGCNYHFSEAIFTVIELINALKLDKVHVLGHSMGACLGSLFAGVFPERILSLYLIEALGPFSAPAETACKQLKTYAHFLKLKSGKQSKGYKRFDDAVLARSAKGYVSLEIAQTLCERAIVEKGGLFYWRHDQRLLATSPLHMTEKQVLSCLKNIQAKTELLLSSEGFSFDEELIANRIKVMRNITVKQLNGGHHIHMEQPEVVSQLLADFYNER